MGAQPDPSLYFIESPEAREHVGHGVEWTLPDVDQEFQLGWTGIEVESDRMTTAKAFEMPGIESCSQVISTSDSSVNITEGSITSSSLASTLYVANRPLFNRNPGHMTIHIEKTENQRTLMRKGAHKSCPLTSIVLGQIASYPHMMIDGDQLPPFIMPACHIDEELAYDCAESGKHRCLSRPLAVCSSLVQMYTERTTANASFSWGLIYAEVKRLRQEVVCSVHTSQIR